MQEDAASFGSKIAEPAVELAGLVSLCAACVTIFSMQGVGSAGRQDGVSIEHLLVLFEKTVRQAKLEGTPSEAS